MIKRVVKSLVIVNSLLFFSGCSKQNNIKLPDTIKPIKDFKYPTDNNKAYRIYEKDGFTCMKSNDFLKMYDRANNFKECCLTNYKLILEKNKEITKFNKKLEVLK